MSVSSSLPVKHLRGTGMSKIYSEDTVGRVLAIRTFRENIMRRTPVLLMGPTGQGRSHILANEISPWLRDEGLEHCFLEELTNPLALQFSKILAEVSPDISPKTLDDMASKGVNHLVFKIREHAARKYPARAFTLVIDRLESCSITALQHLARLLDVLYVCGAYGERQTATYKPDVAEFLEKFVRVEVQKLPKRDLLEIMSRAIEREFIHFPEPDSQEEFCNFVLHKTQGHTKSIIETLRRYAGQTIPRSEIYMVVPYVAQRNEVDMKWKWVILFMLLPMVLAFIYRGSGEHNLYNMLRAIGMAFLAFKLVMPKK